MPVDLSTLPVHSSPVGPVVDVARRVAWKRATVGVFWSLVFAALAFFGGGLIVFGAQMLLRRESEGWIMVFFGTLFGVVLNIPVALAMIRRFREAFLRDCYLRAGPGGLAVRIPHRGGVREVHLRWEDVQNWYPCVIETTPFPFVFVWRGLRFELAGGKVIEFPTHFFGGSLRRINRDLQAAIRLPLAEPPAPAGAPLGDQGQHLTDQPTPPEPALPEAPARGLVGTILTTPVHKLVAGDIEPPRRGLIGRWVQRWRQWLGEQVQQATVATLDLSALPEDDRWAVLETTKGMACSFLQDRFPVADGYRHRTDKRSPIPQRPQIPGYWIKVHRGLFWGYRIEMEPQDFQCRAIAVRAVPEEKWSDVAGTAVFLAVGVVSVVWAVLHCWERGWDAVGELLCPGLLIFLGLFLAASILLMPVTYLVTARYAPDEERDRQELAALRADLANLLKNAPTDQQRSGEPGVAADRPGD